MDIIEKASLKLITFLSGLDLDDMQKLTPNHDLLGMDKQLLLDEIASEDQWMRMPVPNNLLMKSYFALTEFTATPEFKPDCDIIAILALKYFSKFTFTEAAREYVLPLAQRYYPGVEALHYLILVDNDGGYLDDFEADTNDYCEDCISKKIIEYNETISLKYEGNLTSRPESCPESDGFSICATCGVSLDTAIIWTKQEMEHWLDPDTWVNVGNPEQMAYELSIILEGGYGSKDEFPEETEIIACLVIKHKLLFEA